MEKKNFLERESLVLLLLVGTLVFICCVLFVKNRELEKLLISERGKVGRDYYSKNLSDSAYDSYGVSRRLNEFEREVRDLAKQVEKIQETLVSQYFRNHGQRWAENETGSRFGTGKSVKTKDKLSTNFGIESSAESSQNGRVKHGFEITTDQKDGEYRVEISLPEGLGLGLDDVRVSLHNSILTIRARRENRGKTKDARYYSSFNSFFQSFSIPETTATTGDIKKELANGILKLHIPITVPNVGEKSK
jgi:HSP20 family molecular chaperone IbpA